VDEANVKLFILHGVHRESCVKDAKKKIILSCPLLNFLLVYFTCIEKVNYFSTIGL